MSNEWRILVVEDEEHLNQSIVNSLRKDNYSVQGVTSGADAIRLLWMEEFDVVIGDLQMPGADGFELLQWLRTFRPHTNMIMIAAAGAPASTRTQALEAGVVGYLEKPLDLHQLKEELRRLLQQTGFSASLDSFDLLDLIQIINMSRKSIALLINTGLEERGVLRFHNGELIWAEYGILRGEEAFFALAAHKNGTVIHQPWNEQIAPNVAQPLSRLIFQALQYRSKYATMKQLTGEIEPVREAPLQPEMPSFAAWADEIDDSPIMVMAEADAPALAAAGVGQEQDRNVDDGTHEWWQLTGKHYSLPNTKAINTPNSGNVQHSPLEQHTIEPPEQISPVNSSGQRTDLPEWLIEQPTIADMTPLRPSSLSQITMVPPTPVLPPSPAEWQIEPPVQSQDKTTRQFPQARNSGTHRAIATNGKLRKVSPPEWQAPSIEATPQTKGSGPLQSLSQPLGMSGKLAAQGVSLPDAAPETHTVAPVRSSRRNYTALVAALQTLGYSVPGFVAAAVVSMDGQPIAQVAVDDLDIAKMCRYFSSILQGALLSLQEGDWGNYSSTVITSTDRHILLSIISGEREAFQVLITSREADPAESLEIMANVDSAIAAALR